MIGSPGAANGDPYFGGGGGGGSQGGDMLLISPIVFHGGGGGPSQSPVLTPPTTPIITAPPPPTVGPTTGTVDQPAPQCSAGSVWPHGGFFTTGGDVEAGLPGAGASLQGNQGYGVFHDSNTGWSGDHFATGATPSRSQVVMGAHAGASISVGITNAHSANQYSGPFATYSMNVSYGPVQFSWA